MSTLTLHTDTPIGDLRLVSDGVALVGLHFLDGPEPPDQDECASSLLRDAAAEVIAYLAGDLTTFETPLAPAGTEFQLRVWTELRAIAYGATASYGEIAARLGLPAGASRAVGLANGANPIALIVPCHRVIGADGSLVGYGGGLHRKRFLLDLEVPSLQQSLFG